MTKPAASVVLGSVLFLLSCEAPTPPDRPLRPVRVRDPDSTACSQRSRFSGNVEPTMRVDLAFKRGGYVDRVLRRGKPEHVLEEGDTVKRGEILARLQDTDYRVKLAQARAQVEQARVAEIQAKQDLHRTKTLFDTGAVTPALLEGAENRSRATEAQVKQAEAVAEEVALALADCSLKAPFDSIVIKRVVEVGSLVGPGTPAFVLAQTRSMKVTFGVPDMQLERFQVGTAVDVSIDALGAAGRFEGQVSRVAPGADIRTRLFEVEVEMPNPDGLLKTGMIASLGASTNRGNSTALSVPLSAIVRPPGKVVDFAIFVAEGDTLHSRLIEPGRLCGGNVEIASGLGPHEHVVVDGAAQAFDGERIAIAQGVQ